MRIAMAGGHSASARGASGYLDEYDCDRCFVTRLIPALESAGHVVTNCTNEASTANDELATEVALANASDAELFVAVHLNAGGGTGTEVWHYTGNAIGYCYANKLSANIASALKLRDRGAKSTTALYVIRRTNMPAVLIETCFVDRYEDWRAWNDTTWDELVSSVVRVFNDSMNAPATAPVPGNYTIHTISDIQRWLNDNYKASLDVDGSAGSLTRKACVKAAQQIIGVTCDGDFANESAKSWGSVAYGDVGCKVKVMQAMLTLRGYYVGECGLDGSCGTATVGAIKAYQRDHKLTVDGSCGYITSQSLFTW